MSETGCTQADLAQQAIRVRWKSSRVAELTEAGVPEHDAWEQADAEWMGLWSDVAAETYRLAIWWIA